MFVTVPAIDLGIVLRRLSEEVPDYGFSMGGFEDRLKLQKLVYLVQAHGVYLGYDYSYYLRGPYCTRLAQTGFQLEGIYADVKDGRERIFESRDMEKRFGKAVETIKGLGGVREWEIAASLHLLHRSRGMGRRAAIKKVVEKIWADFSEDECAKAWAKLEKARLVEGGD